jgi:NitT/TauT family transport system substrate-binding protein
VAADFWRLRLVALAVLAILLTACGQPAPAPAAQAPDKLTVGFSNITGDNLPPWIAKEGGVFAKNRLDVELQSFRGGVATMSALLAGQLQFAHVGGSEVMSSGANGADVVIVATLAPVYPYIMMAAANIRSMADLKGKKIGISNPGGSADIATRTLLKQEGLDPDKDVTLLALGSHADRTAALLSGQLQAGVDDPPDTAKLEAKGLHPLVDLAARKLPAANTVLAVQRSWAKDHRDIVQRYVDSMVQGIALARKDKAQSISAMKKYFKSDEEQALGTAVDFFLKEVIPALPYPKVEQFAAAKAVLEKKNEKVRNFDVATLLDESFVKSAADRNLHK